MRAVPAGPQGVRAGCGAVPRQPRGGRDALLLLRRADAAGPAGPPRVRRPRVRRVRGEPGRGLDPPEVSRTPESEMVPRARYNPRPVRRLGRILLIALTALSLLLCLASAALWVRGYRGDDTFRWIWAGPPAGESSWVAVRSGGGGVAVDVGRGNTDV